MTSADLSFVVQGAIPDPALTAKACLSIRKHFPDSSIILSTWEGTDVETYNFDTVVFSKDPGAVKTEHVKRRNINRMIVSSSAGISAATTDFVVKTRHDVLFENNNLLKQLERHATNPQSDSVFSSKLVQSHSFIGYPLNTLFCHSSDTVVAGRKDDLLKYFGCQQASEDIMEILVPEQYLYWELLDQEEKEWTLPRLEEDAVQQFPKEDFVTLGQKSLLFMAQNFSTIPADDLGLIYPDRLRQDLTAAVREIIYSLNDPGTILQSKSVASERALTAFWRLNYERDKVDTLPKTLPGALFKPFRKLRLSTLKRLGLAAAPYRLKVPHRLK